METVSCNFSQGKFCCSLVVTLELLLTQQESPGSPVGRSQGGSSPPRQVLFSHLPLHSQVTVSHGHFCNDN